jgi:hypothetical protein
MVVLPHFVTDLLAQTLKPSVSGEANLPLNVGDSVYNASTSITLGTKNISLTPSELQSHISLTKDF